MKFKFEARDYGYTVIARLEKILREKCVEKLGIITDDLEVIVPKESVTKAIIISAVTFGAGHIVNLLIGQAGVDTFFQMGYAIAIGFAFVMIFYKSGSLIPCIVTHSIIDVTSVFSNQRLWEKKGMAWEYGASVFIILVAGVYAIYLHKINGENEIFPKQKAK